MKKYYYVSYQYQCRVYVEEVYINMHPITWKEMQVIDTEGTKPILLFWAEISEEMYNNYR